MAALLACLCLLPDMAAHAQSPPRKVVVNGRVADESGDPVAGATIVERGTSNGVATLSEGEFSIAVLPGAVLDVSCLGISTRVSGREPVPNSKSCYRRM